MKSEKLIHQMTLAEKCAALSGKDAHHTRENLRFGIPSVTLSGGGNLPQNRAMDGTPTAGTIANTWSEETAQTLGAAAAREASSQGIQVLLTPDVNVRRSPLCGGNFEYYSEDPYLAGKLAAAYIRGIQSAGMAACVKYFAVDSQLTNRMTSDSVLDERTLREIYLTNFEIAVCERRPKCLLTSCGRVNGDYADENFHLLQDILRREWGYRGVIITDRGGDLAGKVCVGCNLEMSGSGDDGYARLMHAVKTGKVSEDIIDQRTDELLTLISDTCRKQKNETIDPDLRREIAFRGAEESVVLLKNENRLLPVARSARVAVIGDFIPLPSDGSGEMLDALPDYFPNIIGYAPGFRKQDQPDEALAAQAEQLAGEAEIVIVFLSRAEKYPPEYSDRTHLRLPQNRTALLERLYRVNPNIAAVIYADSAVEMPWISYCKAVVWAGPGGEAMVRAVLRVLVGTVNPSGKLAETFPVSLEDTPSNSYYPGPEATSEYREGIYVGYRYYLTAGVKVLFPFGYGLSYTSFSYSGLCVTQTQVRFVLTNTGDRTGTEIVQVYISCPETKVFRPRRELKGFKRVHLEAGEQKKVEISLDDKAFRYWNVKTNAWEIEGGVYEICVGASSEDIRLRGSMYVAGTNAPDPYEGKDLSCYENCRIANVPDSQFAALLGRKIPKHLWNREEPLRMDDALLQMEYARSAIARCVHRALRKACRRDIAAGRANSKWLHVYHMTFRGITGMTGGAVSAEMAEDLLLMANGRVLRGVCSFVHHFLHRTRLKCGGEEKPGK